MSFRLWLKMGVVGVVMCIGGPALIYYVSPTEEELFKKYNPDLQKRSLENRHQKQQDFDDFVHKLKQYSKSDRPIWDVAAEDQARIRAGKYTQSQKEAKDTNESQDLNRQQSSRPQ